MEQQSKRLFFGLSVEAPWPHTYPQGRILDESSRHLTLAFLGSHPFSKLEGALSAFPTPPYTIGPTGIADKLLFLPEFKPRVVALHANWLHNGLQIGAHQKALLDWLESLGFPVDRRALLPHITLARSPFEEAAWEEAFEPLPFITTAIHLYESIGNLRYTPLWSYPLLRAFEEFEHTADIAFRVLGHDFDMLYLHGALALSFQYPPFIEFLQDNSFTNLDEVVRALNQMISACDCAIGCPLKAVSYHGKLTENTVLEWEMIVDV